MLPFQRRKNRFPQRCTCYRFSGSAAMRGPHRLGNGEFVPLSALVCICYPFSAATFTCEEIRAAWGASFPRSNSSFWFRSDRCIGSRIASRMGMETKPLATVSADKGQGSDGSVGIGSLLPFQRPLVRAGKRDRGVCGVVPLGGRSRPMQLPAQIYRFGRGFPGRCVPRNAETVAEAGSVR